MDYLHAMLRKQRIELMSAQQNLAAQERRLEELVRACARQRWLCQAAEHYWREQLESVELHVDLLAAAGAHHRRQQLDLKQAQEREWEQHGEIERWRQQVRRLEKIMEKLTDLQQRRAREQQLAVQRDEWQALDDAVAARLSA